MARKGHGSVSEVLRTIGGFKGLTSEQQGRWSKLVKDFEHAVAVGDRHDIRRKAHVLMEAIAHDVIVLQDDTKHPSIKP